MTKGNTLLIRLKVSDLGHGGLSLPTPSFIYDTLPRLLHLHRSVHSSCLLWSALWLVNGFDTIKIQTHAHMYTHRHTASLLGRPDIKELITLILCYPFSCARLLPRPCLNQMFVCLVNCLFDHLPVCLLVCTSFSFHCLVITREPCPEPHTHTHAHTRSPKCALSSLSSLTLWWVMICWLK